MVKPTSVGSAGLRNARPAWLRKAVTQVRKWRVITEIIITLTFRAIEEAIMRRQPRRALMILQQVCRVITADVVIREQPQIKVQMLSELVAARETLAAVDSLARVYEFVLWGESDCECDEIASELQSIRDKVRNAKGCLNDAIHMLSELSGLERVPTPVQS